MVTTTALIGLLFGITAMYGEFKTAAECEARLEREGKPFTHSQHHSRHSPRRSKWQYRADLPP